MKRILAVAAAIALFNAVYLSADTGNTMPASSGQAGKYNFKLYILIKGGMKKNTALPDFGWRVLKAFPLRVKEYTYSSRYIDYSAPAFKQTGDVILSGLTEARRKNAVRVAEAVYGYVGSSITARDDAGDITDNPHNIYLTALQVLRAGTGNNLEKCRLACALLRYFTIPSMIVRWNDIYAIEYYLQPLTGKSAWYIMDFTGAYDSRAAYIEPPLWHPIDAKERLNEEWNTSMYLKLTGIKNMYLEPDDAKADAVFTSITSTADAIKPGAPPESGAFYLIKEEDYELRVQPGFTEAKADFTMPFNQPDNYRTAKYYVKSGDPGLIVQAKWPRTEIKPAQDGILYVLPLKFNLKIQ
jgi:hypothetical protein